MWSTYHGPLNGGLKRGGGGFPIWTCPSFFVLFGTCPIFFLIFPATAPARNSPERVCDTIWTFPEKSGKPPVWKPPGLASLKLSLRIVFWIFRSGFAKRGACKRGLRKLGHRTYQVHSNYIPTYQRHGVTMTVIDSNVYSASISRKKSAQPKCASCTNHIWSEVIQEPLPLRPRILVKKSVVLVKRENGFTKTLQSLFLQGFLSKGSF